MASSTPRPVPSPGPGPRISPVALLVAGLFLVSGAAWSAESGFADTMAREHAGDAPVATALSSGAPGGDGEAVGYATVGDHEVTGYLARPDGPPRGGVLVIHEWWGLNDNIRAMARRLAAAGYVALAVDLYRGESADTPEGARELVGGVSEEEATSNLGQGLRWLHEMDGVDRVGVIGWCFGGGWSLRTALDFPDEVDAAVVYYGRPVTDRDRLARLEAPVLGLFGAEDRGIPVSAARELESTLEELGKEVSIHVYEGAGHAFANPSGRNHDPEAAADAWQKSLEFLSTHLDPEGSA